MTLFAKSQPTKDEMRQYAEYYKRLEELQKQKEPYLGVATQFDIFMKKVRESRMDGSVSVADLNEAMDEAYLRLTGGDQARFQTFTNSLYAKDSIPLKLLGGTLVLLGAALVASSILFAPAVITAAGTGLATMYAATAAATVASSAVSIGGAACFFTKTSKMDLAKTERDLDDRRLNENHYVATI